jgi:hypothetical protein
VRVIDGREVTEDEREKCEQVLQATDPSKQMGMYVYTESAQQPANYTQASGSSYANAGTQDGMLKSLMPSGIQDKNSDGSAARKTIAEAGRLAPHQIGTESSDKRTGIMMMGQGMDDRRAEGNYVGPGVMAARRVVSAVSAASAFSRHPAAGSSHAADGTESAGHGSSTSKKVFSSRSQSVPRP